jgi:hypothetical protein
MYTDVVSNIDNFNFQIPKTIVPKPTESDYSNGFIRRYFIQKTNDSNGHIFEISSETYSDLKYVTFWKIIDLKWRIRGPLEVIYSNNGNIDDMGVRASNNAAISMVSSTLKNIGLYLPNLLQFYK